MEAVAGKGAGSSAGGSSVAVAPRVSGGDHPKVVPGYLRPAAGSCHHVCKYGGQHTFEEKKDHAHARKAQPAKPWRQPPAASSGPQRKPLLLKARSVSRRRVVDSSKPEKADTTTPVVVDGGKEEGGEEAVEWKDIVAYEDSSAKSEEIDGYRKKRDVMKGKKSHGNSNEMAGEEESGVTEKKKKSESMNKKLVKSVRSKLSGMALAKPQSAGKAASPSLKNASSAGGKSVKPPPPPPPREKRAAASPAEKKAAREGDEATATDAKEGEPIVAVEAHRPLNQEHAAAATVAEEEERSRPIPAHRRARSMSMISLSSRSVRFPFVRQASKVSGATTFKLRSRSSKAPSDQEEAPASARLKFRSKARAGAGEEPAGTISGGVQLRTRSHRRRGSYGGGGSAGAGGFVVPAVALRHQKTLEKKRSRRLHNTLIEETASRLAKTRKSRVKALVGAFETLISKIGK